MSYNVKILAKVEGTNTYVDLDFIYPNISLQAKEIILQSSGWDIKIYSFNGTMNELKPLIEDGYTELTFNSDKYKQYEMPDFWDIVEVTREFYWNCLKLMDDIEDKYPELGDAALVYVC